MTNMQAAIMIGAAALATQITRWAPFLLFRKGAPRTIRYLGTTLPAAIWGMLVVYCFRNGTLSPQSGGLPELAAGAVTLALQFWKHNMALSIAAGTVIYMGLIQLSS